MKLGKKVNKKEMTVYGFSCPCGCGSSSCHCSCSSSDYQQYSNGRVDSSDTYKDYKVNRDKVSQGKRYSN